MGYMVVATMILVSITKNQAKLHYSQIAITTFSALAASPTLNWSFAQCHLSIGHFVLGLATELPAAAKGPKGRKGLGR